MVERRRLLPEREHQQGVDGGGLLLIGRRRRRRRRLCRGRLDGGMLLPPAREPLHEGLELVRPGVDDPGRVLVHDHRPRRRHGRSRHPGVVSVVIFTTTAVHAGSLGRPGRRRRRWQAQRLRPRALQAADGDGDGPRSLHRRRRRELTSLDDESSEMATMEWIDRAEAFLPSSASGESCEGRRDVYIAYMVRVRGTASRARSPNNNRQEKYAAVEYTLAFASAPS